MEINSRNRCKMRQKSGTVAQPLRAVLITPRGTRAENIRRGRVKRTFLDFILSDQEVTEVLKFIDNERILSGFLPSGQFGAAVAVSRCKNASPIADALMPRLKMHHRSKSALSKQAAAILQIFTCQNLDDRPPSDAQLGLRYCPNTRNAARAWQECVAEAVKELSAVNERFSKNARQRGTSRH